MQLLLTGSNGSDLKVPLQQQFSISVLLFHSFRIKSGVGLIVESDNIGFDKDINLSEFIHIFWISDRGNWESD